MLNVKRIVTVLLTVLMVTCLTACGPSQAQTDFEAATAALETKNQEIDAAIAELQTVIDSEDQPLDLTLIDTAKSLILDANAGKTLVPEMAKDDDAINAQVSELNAVDYTSVIEELNTSKEDLQRSIEQLKLVTNPSEEYVLKKLSGIANITAIEAATEDNDPNGQLHKAGGYTSAVFFESDLVPSDAYIFGDTTLEKGTDGGGCIEVYATPEDAEKRNTYLASFDGTVLSSGAHTVIGTVVVRVSNEMKASDQNKMTQRIIDAFTSLD